KRGYLKFETQAPELERQVTFVGALDATEYTHRISVQQQAYTVAEVVKRLQARLKSIDAEQNTRYAKEYPPRRLREVIEESLREISETRGLISEQNLQHCYRAMGNTNREVAKTVRLELEAQQLIERSTREMRSRSLG